MWKTKKSNLAVVLFVSVVYLLLSSQTVFANAAAEALARRAAASWLSTVDSGMYGRSWDETAGPFRSNMNKDLWVQTLHSLRDPVGRLVSREAQMTTYRSSMPGFPPGEYVVIQYSSSFEKRSSVIETVTVMLDGAEWKVLIYYAF